MEKLVKSLKESLFSRELPLRGRLINNFLFLCTIGGVAGTISTIIQASSMVAIIMISLLPATTIFLQFWVGKTRRYRAGGFIVSLVLCDIVFPIIFFSSGGVRSGMLAYFILGSVTLFLLLGDNKRDCIIMTVLYLTINSICIFISYLYPSLVTPIQSESMLFLDVIVAFVVSASLVQMALMFQNHMYKKEQEIAETAMNAKDEFLASMSHELRTPLNAIIGLSELRMKTKDELTESAHKDIQSIHESGTTLLRIINDILDISKIGSGRFELHYDEYNTKEMINDTISMNKVRIGEKPIEFQINIDPSLPTVLYGDELRIRQILNNILSNAFKYTETGMVKLEIISQHKDDEVFIIIKISDTGIGIHKSDIPLLFSKYHKFDKIKNRYIEGTGLGLAISRELIEMMGGSITVTSVYGKGSEFTIEIPQKIIESTQIGQKTAESLRTFTYKVDKNISQDEFKYISFEGRRALVVDDVELNLQITKAILSLYQLETDCVLSGKEAIELIKEAKIKYDIIFMDHMMPEIDGIETTKIIREKIDSEYAKTIPIVALTANALKGNEELFLANGFHEFLSKPMDSHKLDEVLKKVLL